MNQIVTFLEILCLQFCFSYEITEQGFDKKTNRYGVKLYFINNVEITISHLTVDHITLMSRIGGIIGVGQALVWVTEFCINKIITLNSFLRERMCSL